MLKLGEKGEIPKKEHLRVLLKKYLHKANLKDEFRVIAGKEENILIIKDRKIETANSLRVHFAAKIGLPVSSWSSDGLFVGLTYMPGDWRHMSGMRTLPGT
jgi:hypothetical protein